MAARGNRIVITPERGHRCSGYLSGAYLPGTILQVDTSVALKGGRQTWVPYDRAADGDHPSGEFIVLVEDFKHGLTVDDAWSSGQLAEGFIPQAGCELNLRWTDTDTGTSTNDIAVGTIGMVDDGTGFIVATTSTPETEVCRLNEALTDMVGQSGATQVGVLGWVTWSGY